MIDDQQPGWPYGVEPWEMTVTARDAGLGGTGVCRGCAQSEGSPHLKASGRLCWRLDMRRRRRINLIARFHLIGRHELTGTPAAIRALSWRDALIDDLAAHDLLDREIFRECSAWAAPEIDDVAKHRARFLYLDDGWAGRGWPPSRLAALHDCVVASTANAGAAGGEPAHG